MSSNKTGFVAKVVNFVTGKAQPREEVVPVEAIAARKGRGRPKGRGKINTRSNTVGNILRRARIDRSLGLSDVSNGTGVSVQFISNIEHDRAPLPMNLVTVLSGLLGIDKSFLAAAALQSHSGAAKLHKDYNDLIA